MSASGVSVVATAAGLAGRRYRGYLGGVAKAAVLLGLFVAVLLFTAVSAFAAAPEAPETGVATGVTATTATLHGVLYPHSTPEAGATYEFLYKATGSPSTAECESAGASRAPASPEGVSEEAQQVSQTVSGLAENTEYVVCLATTNAEATPLRTVGEPKAFTTHAAPPVVVSGVVEGVTETTATVQAMVNPEGVETIVYLEYGSGLFTAPVALPASVTEQGVPVSFALTGLQPGTVYPFRVVAFSLQGLVAGGEEQFETLRPLPAPSPNGESAWWHVGSQARPSHLRLGGVAVDEVRELVVKPGELGGIHGAEFFVVVEGRGGAVLGEVLSFATGELAGLVHKPPVTAALVQATLEESRFFGSGDVLVSEVAAPGGSPAGTIALRITVLNGAGYVPTIKVNSGFGETTVPVATEPSVEGTSQVIATVADLGDLAAHGEGCAKVPAGKGKYSSDICVTEAAPGLGEFEKTPIVIGDVLPAGLRAVGIEAASGGQAFPLSTCSVQALTCTLENAVTPYKQVEVRIDVVVEPGAKTSEGKPGEDNEVSVTGGGAFPARHLFPIVVGGTTGFGVEQFEITNEEAGGAIDRQAGSHPFQTTFTVGLNQVGEFSKVLGKEEALPVALPKDLEFNLPPGLIGNPTPFKRCSLAEFFHKPFPTCPEQTVLGVADVTFNEPGVLGIERARVPVFNLEPQKGEPARFGFLVTNTSPVFIGSAIRSGSDYGVVGLVNDITQTAALISSEVTLWGVPGAAEHDAQRGKACLESEPGCLQLGESNPPPFWELPTSCTGPLQASVVGDSWREPLPLDALPRPRDHRTARACGLQQTTVSPLDRGAFRQQRVVDVDGPVG